MLFSYYTLLVALAISLISAYYSVDGLVTIFPGAFLPIILMGGILELAKITTTLWLHRYWNVANSIIKVYLTVSVVVLASITSMGIFGKLSKAHIEASLPSSELISEIKIIDEKIKLQSDRVDRVKQTLNQLNAQVDQRLLRGSSELSAERSVSIRRQQSSERQQLQQEIISAQQNLEELTSRRTRIAVDLQKMEADIGPVKYIAALIYGDRLDASLLEHAVRWIIIAIVAVFDPLAIALLIAASHSIQWEKKKQVVTTDTTNTTNTTNTDIVSKSIDTITQNLSDNLINRTNSSDFKFSDSESDIDPTVTREKIRYVDDQQYVNYEGKLTSIAALRVVRPDLIVTRSEYERIIVKFGNIFPSEAIKNELFIATNKNPHRVYKFDGSRWNLIDKNKELDYLSNSDYIQYLMRLLESLQYSTNDLTEHEHSSILAVLNSQEKK